MIKKLGQSLRLFTPLLPALYITLLLLRIVEVAGFQTLAQGDTLASIFRYGLLYDSLFYLQVLALSFFLFLLVRLIQPAWHYQALYFIGSFWVLMEVFLVLYFLTAHLPLGADMFGYSLKDGVQIIADSVDFNIWLPFKILLPLVLFYFVLKQFKALQWKPLYVGLILLTGLVVRGISLSTYKDPIEFENEYSFYAAHNKGEFFVDHISNYLFEKPVAATQSYDIDPAYPFLRTENTPDVLSAFFNTDSTEKPNLVFIQVEGLGRGFSGPNAYLGSFTPFLDELASKSLYFTNFISAQGRTFATLPSILGSLPFAETGYSDLGNLPPFHSLINVLDQNGYQSNYYGGFEMEFDNQGNFMEAAGVDKIIGAKDFSPSLKMGSPIGYADGDLFTKVLSTIKRSKSPQLRYLQTISMHNPFTVPNQERYNQLVEQRMEKLQFSAEKMEETRRYKNVFSSMMYSDEALHQFMEGYKKLPGYENTIFIITGDHRLPEIPLSTKIDRFHVPLIIFSPMLKRTLQVNSISSHLDITPSLLAFLKHSYHIKTPAAITWVGTGLDIAPAFRNIHKYPLKQGKTVLHNYVEGLYFLDEGKLFQIRPDFDLVPSNDDTQLKKTTALLNAYKAKNNSFIKSQRLMPDSLIKLSK
ncbi:MAG: LTA synthase family protein [Bacteroidota bacterium]